MPSIGKTLSREVSIVGSLRDREVACSASDRQGSNFESCVWRTVSSQSSHHPQEVLLAQFSLYVHKGGLKPDSFHFICQGNFHHKTPSCRKIRSVYSDVKWCFNASWKLKGLTPGVFLSIFLHLEVWVVIAIHTLKSMKKIMSWFYERNMWCIIY